jgi:hypothetical protein
LTGNWLNLFTSKLENMSVPYRGKKRFSSEKWSIPLATLVL